MLQTLDAEKFCSGHSEMTDRQGVASHIEQMKKQQDKVKTLIQQGKDLTQIKGEFNENEAALITSIYHEVKSGS
jgi:cyclase